MPQAPAYITRSVQKRLKMLAATESTSKGNTKRADEQMESFAGPDTGLTDIIHLPSILSVLLNTLTLSDLAHLAVSSKACAAVLRPDKIKLDINRSFELQALRGLFRLGCLDQLREATVGASYGDATAGSYLGILGMCPRLRQLSVHCKVNYKSLEKDDTSFRGLVAGLPIHLTRTVHLVGVDSSSSAAAAAQADMVAAAAAFAPGRLLPQLPQPCVKHFDRSWQPTETAALPVRYW